MDKIATLFAELTVKDTGLKTGLVNAEKQVKSTASKMNSALSAVGGALAAAGVGAFASQAIKAFAESAEAAEKLRAALARTGDAGQLKRFQDLASEIQTLTVYEDDAVIAGMAMAKQMGIQTKDMEKATKAAVGLAARFGIDIQQAFEIVGKASQGIGRGLKQYGINIDEGASKTEIFNRVLKEGMSGWQQAGDAINTPTGQAKQLANALGDLNEALGEGLIPAVKLFNSTILPMIRSFNNLPSGVKSTTVAIVGLGVALVGLAAAINSVKASGILTFFSTMAANITRVTGVAVSAKIALAALGKVALVAAAAFAGWEIGKWISDVTGLSDAVGRWADNESEGAKRLREVEAEHKKWLSSLTSEQKLQYDRLQKQKAISRAQKEMVKESKALAVSIPQSSNAASEADNKAQSEIEDYARAVADQIRLIREQKRAEWELQQQRVGIKSLESPFTQALTTASRLRLSSGVAPVRSSNIMGGELATARANVDTAREDERNLLQIIAQTLGKMYRMADMTTRTDTGLTFGGM